jgi:hypothetical protein
VCSGEIRTKDLESRGTENLMCALDMFANLSGPWFSHLFTGRRYRSLSLRVSVMIIRYFKYLMKSQAHGQYSIEIVNNY